MQYNLIILTENNLLYLFQGLLSPVTPEGFFPRPVEGQSLLSFLSSQDFHTCANLDKVSKTYRETAI